MFEYILTETVLLEDHLYYRMKQSYFLWMEDWKMNTYRSIFLKKNVTPKIWKLYRY